MEAIESDDDYDYEDKTKRARRWLLTWWPRTDADTIEALLEDFKERLGANLRFFIMQFERCPLTQRKHGQGYLEMKNVKGRNAMKNVHPTAHWIQANGTGQENVTYCSRIDKRWIPEIGPVVYGQLADEVKPRANQLKDFCEELKEAVSQPDHVWGLRDVAMKYPDVFVRNHNGLDKFYEMLAPITNRPFPYILWFRGGPGTGKSRLATYLLPQGYRKPRGEWWNGYACRKHVVFDEFHLHQLPVGTFLELADGYPMRLNKKQGHDDAAFDTMAIITHEGPASVYGGYHPFGSITRRIGATIAMHRSIGDDGTERFLAQAVYHLKPPAGLRDAIRECPWLDHLDEPRGGDAIGWEPGFN